MSESSSELSPGKSSHLVVLGFCLSILLVALALEPAGSQLRVGQTTLPGLCVLKQTTGVPCPGCGLTRSMVAAAHGDWKSSYGFNRLGWVFWVFILLQVLYRLSWLAFPPHRYGIARQGRFLDMALIPLTVLLLLNWIPTLIGTFIGR